MKKHLNREDVTTSLINSRKRVIFPALFMHEIEKCQINNVEVTKIVLDTMNKKRTR